MKKIILLLPVVCFLQLAATAQNVGVGTNTPVFKLDVKNGSINTDSVYRIGTFTVLSTTGIKNTFAGVSAGANNTSGSNNTFLGNAAGFSNTTASRNTFLGYSAGTANTTGNNNVAIGIAALFNNTAGQGLVAIGDSALYNQIFNPGNNYGNTAVGSRAGFSTTTGYHNTFLGESAGFSNMFGINNVFLGYTAGFSNTTGNGNIALGFQAGFSNTAGNSNTILGNRSGLNNTGDANVFVGTNAGINNTIGDDNTFIGNNAGGLNITGNQITLLGASSNSPGGNLTNSTAIGFQASINQSNLMVFGNDNVLNWGFGVTPTAGRAIQVGSNGTNGNGAFLTDGGVWTNGSSLHFKEDFSNPNGREILQKIAALRIMRWRYKGSSNEYHIGPIAEEFYHLFNVGTDEKYISTIDPSGVALAGVQELVKENKELRKNVDQLTEKINTILKELEVLQRKVK